MLHTLSSGWQERLKRGFPLFWLADFSIARLTISPQLGLALGVVRAAESVAPEGDKDKGEFGGVCCRLATGGVS